MTVIEKTVHTVCAKRTMWLELAASFPWSGRLVLLMLALLAPMASGLNAYTVDYVVNGTFGSVISGLDPLSLSGKSFRITGALSTSAVANCNANNGYTTGLSISIDNGSPLSMPSSCVTLDSATSTITLSGQVTVLFVQVPITATAKLPGGTLTTSTPSPFGSASIQSGSTVTYGSTATTLNISGSASATTTAPDISAAPSSLSFSYQISGSLPASKTTTISSSGSVVSVSASTSTTSGGNWLNVSGGGSTPSTLTVSIDSVVLAGLGAGTYNGNVRVTASQAKNSPINVPVTLNVTPAAPMLSANPPSFSFSFQQLSSPPGSQGLAITSTISSLAYSIGVSTSSGGNWLAVSPGGGTTNSTNETVSVNVSGLSPNVYSGTITVTAAGATNSPLQIPVTLTVTAAPNLTAAPGSLAFAFTTGGSVPSPQSIAVGSTGSALNFSASASTSSGGAWLAVSGGGTTPGNLSVSMNAGVVTSLGAGTYNGSVTITSSGAGNSPVTVPVSLTVSTQSLITVNPASLVFLYQSGGSVPAAQPVNIGSSGAALAFSVSVSTGSGGNWLAAAGGGNTPGIVNVSLNAGALGSLAAGTYNGTVTVTAAGAGNTPLGIPVSLTVSAQPLLTYGPTSLTFGFAVGGTNPSPQNISLSSTGAALSYTVSTSGGAWLSASPSNGTTPGSVTVSVNATNLGAGTYNGSVTFTAAGAGNSPVNVPVTLNVTGVLNISASPSSVSFLHRLGRTPPSAQSISVTSGGTPVSFTASGSGASWLTVSSGGTTPGNVTLSVTVTGLTEGTYNASVTISAPGATNSPLTIPVVLRVTESSTLDVNPSDLSFSYALGSGAFLVQRKNVLLTSGAGSLISFTASTSGETWLSVAPASGQTPGTIVVSVDATGLGEGVYKGAIILTGVGASNAPVTIPVVLTILTPDPVINAITDAASFLPGLVAPGSFVTLWGDSMGPQDALPLELTPDGTKVATKLGDVEVFFDQTPAPLLMAQANQINAVAPFSVGQRPTVKVYVMYKGRKSNEVELTVAAAAPAIFTTEQTGVGQGAILNQDTSLNSETNPADQGSVIVIFAEGGGQTDPPGLDGLIAGIDPATWPKTILPISVLIDGLDAELEYDGAAPLMVAGSLQINAVLPPGVRSGAVSIVVKAGTFQSQPGVTVWVR